MIALALVVRDTLANIERCIQSTTKIEKRIYVVDQGCDDATAAYLKEIADLYVRGTRKNLADIDRQYLYDLVQEDWILALDSDEYLSPELVRIIPRLIKQPFDIFWFNFKNLVDKKDIKEILGNDPHPRLWRKGALIWPTHAHTFPEQKSPRVYFVKEPYVIVHDREFEKVKATQAERAKVIPPDKQEIQNRFLQSLEALLRR